MCTERGWNSIYNSSVNRDSGVRSILQPGAETLMHLLSHLVEKVHRLHVKAR